MGRWYERCWRRNVVDMHITDWDERFLAQVDPQRYVALLQQARAQSAVIYAHSHVGHCYYPTQVGHMHRGLKGRDLLGELIGLCQQNGIAAVAYYSLIYDDWAYRHHPDWRIIMANGEGAAERSRYGVCCPNSPYREYAAAHIHELLTTHAPDGLRLDMTFWPAVCYCPHCARRYAVEGGGELPRTVDWGDARWVAFQRRREAWLVEFAQQITDAARKARPGATVEHQASTYTAGWRLGVTEALAGANDFLQGDFYGDALQGSVVRKLFYNLTPSRPFAFETSASVDLGNHTAVKSRELLQAKASACLADGGAFVFIDAIDPAGTLHGQVYERISQVFAATAPLEPYLGEGHRCQDVAVYLSTASKFDPADNGKPVDDPRLSARLPHVEGVVSACKTLIESHIPFGVITRRNLQGLDQFHVVVLPNVLMMDEEEIAAFRRYVRAGGRLYASKATSLGDTAGGRRADLGLGDVFGVSYVAQTGATFTYVAPEPASADLFPSGSVEYPLGIAGTQLVVRAREGAVVLARLVLPHTDPADATRYVSIHSNPPGIATGCPSVVLNHYGQGQALYVSADLESGDVHRDTFAALIRLLGQPFSWEADAPKAVELTLTWQEANRRALVALVNFQQQLPNVPVFGVAVRIRLGGRKPLRLLSLPEESPLPLSVEDDWASFVAPRVDTLAMYALEYS